MSMSQRAADELEHRRGLVLGLTLAEVLLLLLFLLLLALSWQMLALQRQASAERDAARKLADKLTGLEATLGSLTPLLKELQSKGGLDVATVQELTAKLARADMLEAENARLEQTNSELSTLLGNIKLIGPGLAKMKAINDALAAAATINPNDPPEALTRAVEIVKRLGPNAQPDQVKPLTEMMAESDKLRALSKAIEAAIRINPSNPPEAMERALEVLQRVGPDTQPDQVVTVEQHASVVKKYDQARRELEGLRGPGNGLTYPSCWKAPDGQIEYFFDVTIRDGGLIVRDATPGRAKDPDVRLVGALARNELIKEQLFRSATAKLFEHSKKKNCRYYSIVRDETGPASKPRYKQLRELVEAHFYPLHRNDPWVAERSTPAPPGSTRPNVPIGGEYVPPPIQLRR